MVTSIPTVLTPATGIKMRSSGQAEKLVAIKRSRKLFRIKIKAVHRLDSTHFLSSIKDQARPFLRYAGRKGLAKVTFGMQLITGNTETAKPYA